MLQSIDFESIFFYLSILQFFLMYILTDREMKVLLSEKSLCTLLKL